MTDIKAIDANALMTALHDVGGCDADPETWAAGYDAGIDLAIEMLKSQPTINPDDLRPQGRWITHNNGITECSECHTLGSPQWKCYPVCTAMMDATDNNVGSKTDGKEPSDD